LLAASIAGNVFQYLYNYYESWIVVNFPNANSRDTYFSVHNIAPAHALHRGEGVKIGILDWGFGFSENEELYAGGLDFSNNPYNFNHVNEHGLWMAQVLKEIAPGSEVYALGTFIPDNENEWVDALIEAVNWSIENDIEILTMSHQRIARDDNRTRFDEAVNRAIEHGIVTTFIHYDNPNNILPWGLFSYREGQDGYRRTPDINIYHYDYNTLFVTQFLEYERRGHPEQSYMSVSSMSPVTAGFVAILKNVNDGLSPAEYKDILIRTSYSTDYDGAYVERVVDIGNAVRYLLGN
jgi:hypothetical protein